MPYIKLKVSQDLFEELGLSSTMELVRSGGSVKFIPLCNERVFDCYKSPLLTSPIFGNHPNVEKELPKTIPNVFPCEPALNIGPSVSVPASKKCKIVPVDSDSSAPVKQNSVLSIDLTKCFSDKTLDDIPHNNPSLSGNESGVICFEDHSDLNQFGSFEDSGSNLGTFSNFMFLDEEAEGVKADDTVRSPVQQVCPSVTESPIAVPSKNSFDFRLPFTSEPSTSSTISTSSRFNVNADKVSSIQLDSRGRLSSVTLTTPRLTSAPQEVQPPSPAKKEAKRRRYNRRHCDSETSKITYPRICEKCGLIFDDSSGFRSHLKRCEEYSKKQTISLQTEKIILPSYSDSMVSSTVDKYIPLKEEPKSGPRFFVRKKAPTDIKK